MPLTLTMNLTIAGFYGQGVNDTGGSGTPDTTNPSIVSTSPADNDTGFATSGQMTVTFDENIQFGTGNITLRKNDTGFANAEVYDVTTDTGRVSISGAVLTITPQSSLDTGTEYAIRIDATAIDDTGPAVPNSFAGIADDTTFSFTTQGPMGDTGNNITLGSVSKQQYHSMEPIDLSSYTDTGDKLYSIDLPEGLELMRDGHRILGAPINTQSETNISVYCQSATESDFWIYVPLTVTASTDTGYVVSNSTEFYALAEVGSGYTGPGCVITLSAGAVLDDTGTSHFNRFSGLTSPIIIRSADTGNPGTWSGKTFGFQASSAAAGDVAFVNVNFSLDQDTGLGPRTASDTLIASGCVEDFSSVTPTAISFINCKFESNVQPATSKEIPSNGVAGVYFSRDSERVSVVNCEFTKMFVSVIGAGSNFLMKGCESYETWDDLLRATTGDVTGISSYVMVADNAIYNTVSDGYQRHADMIQIGSGKSGGYMNYFEGRGNFYSESTLRELPTLATSFNKTITTSSNVVLDTGGDHGNYRMETDVAGTDLSVTLPAIASVANGWECCVVKFSGDTGGTVSVIPNGSETIDSDTGSYQFSGTWKSIRFYKNGSAWSTRIYQFGVQGMLYQDDGGLSYMDNSVSWYSGGISVSQTGNSNEVPLRNTSIENVTLAACLPGDVDGDGIIDRGDGFDANVDKPYIWVRASDTGQSFTIQDCIVGDIQIDDTGVREHVTITNTDTGQTTSDSGSVTGRFVGEGAPADSRIEIIRNLRIKKGSVNDGQSRGAVGIGMADMGYDFINKRPRLPGAPNVTTAPVIQEDTGGTSYSISTAAAFSESLTETTSWHLIKGRRVVTVVADTGSVIPKSAITDSGDLFARVTGASSLGDAIADSTNLITVTADTVAPTLSSTVPVDNDTGIATSSALTATFSENIQFGTGNITLRKNDTGFANAEVYNVTTDTGRVSISANVLTITPLASLDTGTEYAIRIDATAIDDTGPAVPNSYAGISDDTTWSFTTQGPAAASVTWADSIVDPTNISDDQRRKTRSRVSYLGQGWQGSDSGEQSIDSPTFVPTMDTGTYDQLQDTGPVVYVVDITDNGTTTIGLQMLGVGSSSWNLQPAFNFGTNTWVGTPAGFLFYDFVEVGSQYGDTGEIYRLALVYNKAAQTGTDRHIFEVNTGNTHQLYRSIAIFDRGIFDTGDTDMMAQISALGVFDDTGF